VLAFVVLLTGLVVAYFSRAMSDRQISTSSASQTRVQAFALGATNSIIDDLKQEIAAGSTTPNPMPSPVTTNLYIPTVGAMVPYHVLKGTSVPATLVKQSVSGKSFFPTSANYPSASSFPASNRAALAPTSAVSMNGRSISDARWNKPLFLLPTNLTNLKPSDAGVSVPDWILVARNGSNPTVWNALTLAARGNKYTGTASTDGNVVVGRYAYNIYDEGGLLDANVAGYPNPTPAPSPSLYFTYKSSEALADLTTIGLSSSQINSLVGWRNNASAKATGNFPTFTINGTSFLSYVLGNTGGDLITSNTALQGNQSDHKFTGRQQLLSFMTSLSNTTTMQSALTYLTTFSRDINQPSVVPNNPQVLSQSNGGNNSTGYDSVINPNFLTARVTNTFKRNDGSTAVVGEPLVKKRFALNRLAWLTYKGPSANNMSDPVVQQTITLLGGDVASGAQDPVYQFVAQGTAQNIYNYFGLSWVQNGGVSMWIYDHTGYTPLTTIPASGAAIKTLATATSGGSTVAAAVRDPDMAELLKASFALGSKGKGAINLAAITASGTGYTATSPYVLQTKSDVVVDNQIIQIIANMIDQFDVDGYPTHIIYTDSSGIQRIFHGIENNPYLYRVRSGLLKLRNENPVLTGTTSPVPNAAVGTTIASAPTAPQGVLKDTGVAAMFEIPEIWNPHDVNSSLGNPRPTQFRIVVDSVEPYNVGKTTVSYNLIGAAGWDTNAPGNPYSDANAVTTGAYVPFSRQPNGAGPLISRGILAPNNYKGLAPTRSAANFSAQALTFTVPTPATGSTSSLFREPTMLVRPNIPTGSQLKMTLLYNDADIQGIMNDSGANVWTGNGLTSVAQNPLGITPVPQATQDYTGFVVGLFPVEWSGARTSGEPQGTTNIYRSFDTSSRSNNGANLTYSIQYQDVSQNWVNYDSKYTAVPGALDSGKTILGNPASGRLIQWDGNWASFADPRTARFTTPFGANISGQANPPGLNANEWLNVNEGTIMSDRPDTTSGFGFIQRFTNNFMTFKDVGWKTDGSYIRQGLFSQNNTGAVDDGLRYNGDATARGGGTATYFSDADGVVRRAMGGYVTASGGHPAGSTVGLPMATVSGSQSQSRPVVLNRPFRSVAELGYVFSDTPWRNLDFFTAESGDSAVLDVFTVNDVSNSANLVAGKVNLNTQQPLVLQAILNGAYKDELNASSSSAALTSSETQSIAKAIITRTSSTTTSMGPFRNLNELVGKWNGSAGSPIDGSTAYSGLASDLTAIYGSGGTNADPTTSNIQRFRESPMRALSSAGQTRVWNLMIDVIAQTGRYTSASTSFNNFLVDGEQRYWIHIALDRMTGQVLDKQIEVVKE